jgi:hypothetical protein
MLLALLVVLAILALLGGVYLSPFLWILLLLIVVIAVAGYPRGWYRR